MQEELKERAERYIENLRGVVSQLSPSKATDLAKEYFSDAQFYLERGDYVSSIVCSTYAEGILDGLKEEGLIDFSWQKPMQRKVVTVAGTWDIIHPGHIKFLEEASALGELVVIVARDKNVKAFKGHAPVLGEQQRLAVVSSLKPVKKALLGNEDGDPIKTVADLNPDYFVLGPDQPYDPADLQNRLRKYGAKTEVRKIKNRFEVPGLVTSTSKIVEKIKSIS